MILKGAPEKEIASQCGIWGVPWAELEGVGGGQGSPHRLRQVGRRRTKGLKKVGLKTLKIGWSKWVLKVSGAGLGRH